MKTLLAAGTAAALLLGTAQAAVVQTGTVAVDGSDTVTQMLEAGVEYTLTISGSFFIGGPGDGLADAEYYDLTNPQDATSTLEIGIAIDGADVDFGDFNASSVYSTTIMGMGAAIALRYIDGNYADNSGSLSFSLERADPIPLPAGALLFAPVAAAGLISRRRKQNAA